MEEAGHEITGPLKMVVYSSVECWQRGLALAYNYAISHPGHAVAAGSCGVFRVDVCFSSTGKRGKRWSAHKGGWQI
jgi:hypothetical protein